jgi:hypothetical protein
LAAETNPLFNIEEDKGVAEFYQYIKVFSIVVLLGVISVKKSAWNYVAWALVFTYLLVDDSMQIHENVGRALALNLDLPPAFGLRARDFGELAVTATAGILLAAVLAWAYRTGSQMFRKVSRDLVLLILLLVFFGVVVDMVHEALDLGWQVRFILGLVEDGGEMVAMSLIAWYVFLIQARNDVSGWYLTDFLPGGIGSRARTTP